MKTYPCPYLPATPEQAALLAPLVDQLLTPVTSPFGAPQLPLIKETSAEFVALKTERHALLLGLDPSNVALAAVISLATPAQIASKFGSLDEALVVGNKIQNGAALLYGLGTSAMRYRDAAAAEALVRFSPRMSINFQFTHWMIEVIEPSRMDAIMLEITAAWTNPRDAMTWVLLEYHRQWSAPLSQRLIDVVKTHGTDARTAVWSWRGNGYADNTHPSLLAEAIEALKPHVKTQPNAKRWATKLKKRLKGA
ncbi:MAG: hypothetical protein K2X32_02385 [Phycisphaerales bacterium]|nr:hypothetical protein [Phycisphaerales bacterium]